MPLSQISKEEEVSLKRMLLKGDLDHACQSCTSFPSLDQSGHGSCVSTALPMWTLYPRARNIINEAYDSFQFNHIPVSHDVRSRLLFSIFNSACDSTDGAQYKFGKFMLKLDDVLGGAMEMLHDKQTADLEELYTVNEWIVIYLARHIACDGTELHAKLLRDLSTLTPV